MNPEVLKPKPKASDSVPQPPVTQSSQVELQPPAEPESSPVAPQSSQAAPQASTVDPPTAAVGDLAVSSEQPESTSE